MSLSRALGVASCLVRVRPLLPRESCCLCPAWRSGLGGCSHPASPPRTPTWTRLPGHRRPRPLWPCWRPCRLLRAVGTPADRGSGWEPGGTAHPTWQHGGQRPGGRCTPRAQSLCGVPPSREAAAAGWRSWASGSEDQSRGGDTRGGRGQTPSLDPNHSQAVPTPDAADPHTRHLSLRTGAPGASQARLRGGRWGDRWRLGRLAGLGPQELSGADPLSPLCLTPQPDRSAHSQAGVGVVQHPRLGRRVARICCTTR